MQNKQRILVKCVREAAAEIGAGVSAHCDDWVLTVRRGDVGRHIVGYDFPLNSATAKLLAQDKTALSEVLEAAGVPRVEHRIVHHPKMGQYVPMAGNWPWLLEYLKQHGRLVIKPNEGTGGADVYRVGTAAELEHALSIVHGKTRAAVVCPYVEIGEEYRVIVLMGEVVLCYRKVRACVVGDGRRTVAELVVETLGGKLVGKQGERMGVEAGDGSGRGVLAALRQTPWEEGEFSMVPAAGVKVPVNWRHNLGQGAGVELVREGEPVYGALREMAVAVARVVGVGFASVDIVEVRGGLRVLEVNAGVMMESLARQLPGGMEIARSVYGRAVRAMFDVSG